MNETVQVGFTFCCKDFGKGETWVDFRLSSDIIYDDIYVEKCCINQSHSWGFNIDTFCLDVTREEMPVTRERSNDNRTSM